MEIHASLKAEEVFFLGSVGITNSMVMTWLAMALLVGVSWSVTRNLKVVPSGMQSLLEYALEFIFGLVIGSAGQKGRRFFPLIATIFLFIITANYMALLPGVGTISVKNPKLAHGSAHAEAPLLMAASFVLGLGLGGTQPIIMSMLYRAAPAERGGEAVGMRTQLLNITQAGVPLIFGLLGAQFGMAPVFVAMGVALLWGAWYSRRQP